MKNIIRLIAIIMFACGSAYCVDNSNVSESLLRMAKNPTEAEVEKIIEVLKKYSSVTTAISSKDYNAALFLLDYVDDSSETDYLLSLFVWSIHFKESNLNPTQIELMYKIVDYKKFNVNSFTSFMGAPNGVYKKNTFHNLLSLALHFDQIHVFNILLEAGADVNAQHGCVLTHALESEDIEKIRLALDSGANLDSLDQAYLYQKINDTCNLALLKLLIDYGADIDKENLLLTAICQNKLECVKFMLEIGANPGEDGNILYRAIEYGDYDLVKYLLDYGVKLADGNSINGNYLACAIRKWDAKTVGLLIERGVDVAQKIDGVVNVINYTLSLRPKNKIEEARQDEILRILVKHGASIS